MTDETHISITITFSYICIIFDKIDLLFFKVIVSINYVGTSVQ